MADQLNLIFTPTSYSELFSAWNRYPSAVPYAGGTALIREQGRQILELPPIILSLEKLEEMHRINRSERFIEIGAMAKLGQILNMGKLVPLALRRCLEGIAGMQLRNLATIGGNLCFPDRRLDSSAALTALEAQYELRSMQSVRWISATRFSSMPASGGVAGPTALNPQELLTRIRVPLDNWDYTAYKKFPGQKGRNNVVVFLAKTQKNVLSDIRIIYKTETIWRDKDSESIVIGEDLPLNHKIATDFVESWESYLRGIWNVGELFRQELINFIELNIHNLAE
jgi:CO/xanthine dehydrogenase FAD-binding subunit